MPIIRCSRRRCSLFRSLCALVCINCLIMSIYVKINIGSVNEDFEVFSRFPKEIEDFSLEITPPIPTKCHPKGNIVFVKTHKTGSSTVTNILNRFGEKNQLFFALPQTGQSRLGWPWSFQKEYMEPFNVDTKPNILCHHARYSRPAMEKVMPKNVFYITILRNPVTQFESTFSYMTFQKILGMDTNSSDSLVEFFKNPKDILVNYVLTQDLTKLSDRLKLIRNGMFYDLGLDSSEFDNEASIEKKILQLEREFDLVMIMEYFDESLIMLKRLLCWDIDDVVYFHLNSRPDNEKRQNISDQLSQSIRSWSRADVKLYNYFHQVFLDKLNIIDESFYEEVEELRNRSRTLQETCLSEKTGLKKFQGALVKKWILRGGLSNGTLKTCQNMRKNEVEYLKDLRISQKELLQSLFPEANKNITNYV